MYNYTPYVLGLRYLQTLKIRTLSSTRQRGRYMRRCCTMSVCGARRVCSEHRRKLLLGRWAWTPNFLDDGDCLSL